MEKHGQIEERVAKRAAYGAVKSAILQTVAVAGVVSLAIAAPNVLKVIPRSLTDRVFGISKGARAAAISKLVRDGYLKRERRNGTSVLRITPQGTEYLEKKMRVLQIARPRRWDKKWRLIIFDIGEKRRKTRDLFRRSLKAAGFYKLQDSAWVFPFPCEEFIALVKADLHVGKDILYVVAEELENDRWLREHFELGK